tara:strand:- start:153 stop:512 length:360 start_codon:yes stop_codon:yes gene_type:complete
MTYEYKCKLVRIIDGDTIDISLDLGFSVWMLKQRVRLLGINTPESRTRNLEEKALGLAAKAHLKKLLPKRFIIKTSKDGKGKFGRILAEPIVDGVNICQQMIDDNHARPYFGGKKAPWT